MQHSSEEEGLLLHFLDCVMTECVDVCCWRDWKRLNGKISRRSGAEKKKKKKSRFVSTVVLHHTRQATTLKKDEAFPAQNTKWFTHT